MISFKLSTFPNIKSSLLMRPPQNLSWSNLYQYWSKILETHQNWNLMNLLVPENQKKIWRNNFTPSRRIIWHLRSKRIIRNRTMMIQLILKNKLRKWFSSKRLDRSHLKALKSCNIVWRKNKRSRTMRRLKDMKNC